MLTSYGKFLRKLRIDFGESQHDMASKLSVTASYLFAVEMGKRNIPTTWTNSIASLYALTDEERGKLDDAAMNSVKEIKIRLEKVSSLHRETAILFAKEFNAFDEVTLSLILGLLNKPLGR